MRMKQFEAANMRDALAKARSELGPQAVILSTKEIPPLTKLGLGKPRVRVTAAVDDEDPKRYGTSYLQASRQQRQDPAFSALQAAASQEQVHISPQATELQQRALQQQTAELDQALAALGRGLPSRNDPRSAQALRMARDPERRDYAQMVSRIAVQPPPWRKNGPHVVVLLGASGVGKTITAAKIAAQAKHYHGVQAGLLCADGMRIGAAEQLGAYANILELPFAAVRSPQSIQKALRRLRGCSLIIVDTPAASPRDQEQMEQIVSIQSAVQSRANSESLIVLSASQREEDQRASCKSFRIQGGADALIYTKIDEAEQLSCIADTTLASGLPISLLSASRQVLGKLIPAQPEYVARLAMHRAA